MQRCCAAGELAQLSFTLAYAAPEVIAAYDAGQPTHLVHPAVDVWALGVIAFEMLTGETIFEPFTPNVEIMAHIAGRKPMPWEGPRRSELLRKLHVFQNNVLECLDREPARRPTMDVVVRGWEHLFRNSTTTSTHVTSEGVPAASSLL
jgi:serine/threonine protein kinase